MTETDAEQLESIKRLATYDPSLVGVNEIMWIIARLEQAEHQLRWYPAYMPPDTKRKVLMRDEDGLGIAFHIETADGGRWVICDSAKSHVIEWCEIPINKNAPTGKAEAGEGT